MVRPCHNQIEFPHTTRAQALHETHLATTVASDIEWAQCNGSEPVVSMTSNDEDVLTELSD